jgi:hypothetical protein
MVCSAAGGSGESIMTVMYSPIAMGQVMRGLPFVWTGMGDNGKKCWTFPFCCPAGICTRTAWAGGTDENAISQNTSNLINLLDGIAISHSVCKLTDGVSHVTTGLPDDHVHAPNER